MSKEKRKRILIILLCGIGVVSLMLFSILPENPVNGLSGPFSFMLRPFEKLFNEEDGSLAVFFRAVSENSRLSEENEALRGENLALRLEIKENEQAAEAYESLKSAFNLKDRFPSRSFVAGNVLQRPLDREFCYYRLDVGTLDGLDWDKAPGFGVIDEEGCLAGRIASADAASSKMLAPTHPGFAAVCYAEKDTGSLFTLKGRDKRGVFAVDILPDCAIQTGDRVYTSGEGGLFPEGILCGEVVSVSAPDALGLREAKIRLASPIHEKKVFFVLLPLEDAVETAPDGNGEDQGFRGGELP